MKHIIAAIALLAAATLPALAQTQLDPLTQEYRMWSAERMIERLNKLGAKSHPTVLIIRDIAASGDDVLWARVVNDVHKLEADLRK